MDSLGWNCCITALKYFNAWRQGPRREREVVSLVKAGEEKKAGEGRARDFLE